VVGWQEWIRTVEIEPAIAAGDVAALERKVEALLRTGCRIIHVNAPEGGAREAVAALAPMTRKYDGILDLHIGGDDFAGLAAAGANNVTFDAAAVDDVPTEIAALRDSGAQVGVAFGADFEPEHVASVSAGADLVLCACAGDASVLRVRELAVLLPPGVTLQVEGDVSYDNVLSLYRAGAKVLIADEPIFSREDLPRAYRRLVQALA
jgi:pentose-5-phosphate-3-epimerase